MHAAQSYGMKDNTLPFGAGKLGFPDTTIFAALAAKGISNRYFYTDIPVSALWGAPGIARSGQVQEYYERCASGTLPSLSFVDPAFNGEEEGTSGDEHPHGDVRFGQAFMADVVHAFLESPQFKRGALFIVYDEWGGFFDHVRPPRVPDVRSNADVAQDFGQMGIRIPAVDGLPVRAPRPRRPQHLRLRVDPEADPLPLRARPADDPRRLRPQHRALLRLRGEAATTTCPTCPTRSTSSPQACAPGAPGVNLGGTPALARERPKEHDLAALHTSGYLERLGFDYRPATPHLTFRHPSSMGLRP